MTVQEIREMLDSTITANGRGEITAKALNLAFHTILDHIEGGSFGDSEIANNGNGLKGSSITVLLPNDATFNEDNENSELIANNIKCFETLKNQTEPLIIFLQYLGSPKPLSQTALRLRHLYDIGEGTDFFAFSYPVVYSSDYVIGGIALAADMFRLDESGKITKIDVDGFNSDEGVLKTMCGVYNHDASGTTVSSNYLPKIYCNELTNEFFIENLFGNSTSNASSAQITLSENVLTVHGGWTHEMFGEIGEDLVFDVTWSYRPNGTRQSIEKLSMRCPVTIAGWSNFNRYELTKMA